MKITIEGIELDVSSLSITVVNDKMRQLMDNVEQIQDVLIDKGGYGLIFPLTLPRKVSECGPYHCRLEYRDPSSER